MAGNGSPVVHEEEAALAVPQVLPPTAPRPRRPSAGAADSDRRAVTLADARSHAATHRQLPAATRTGSECQSPRCCVRARRRKLSNY